MSITLKSATNTLADTINNHTSLEYIFEYVTSPVYSICTAGGDVHQVITVEK